MKNINRSLAALAVFATLLMPTASQAQSIWGTLVNPNQSIWGTLLGLFS